MTKSSNPTSHISHNALRIGITGQSGFLGTHLTNNLNLFPEEFKVLPFKDEFFNSTKTLSTYVKECDVIVHLAAMNRHNDPEVIYKTNIELTEKLTRALDIAATKPHILISSSVHETLNNLYGKSKKAAREILLSWTKKNKAPFTGFLFPNIYGPFGNPFYNSFIATFSHLLNNGGEPNIEVDRRVPLLYVNNAVTSIIDAIREEKKAERIIIDHEKEIKVTSVLDKLYNYKLLYTDQGVIPNIATNFDINLFHTFRSYIDHKTHFPVKLKKNTDDRGTFVETIRSNTEGQFSYSTTKPGITRGNHFHTSKIERFTVIKGKARIQLRKTGTSEILEFNLDGNQPSYVDMPIWYTHNITNTGSDELLTLFWINEFYDPYNPDTYYEEV